MSAMSTPKTVWKDGNKLNCPLCHGDVLYWRFSVPSIPWPFFYCERCNDVFVRLAQPPPMSPLSENSKEQLAQLEAYWHAVLDAAPPCPCGGRFGFWTNVKCPHCWYEFPYARGTRNVELRINEPYVIAIDGATVLDGEPSSDWIARVRVT
jgi:hypothetical protein